MDNTTLDREEGMEELNRAVAQALGIRRRFYEDGRGGVLRYICGDGEYSPATNWEQCGKLIEEYWKEITYELSKEYGNCWYVRLTGKELRIAVCRAIISSQGEASE